MTVSAVRQALADVKALGAAAPARALYEASKRSNFHSVLFRSNQRRHYRSSLVELGNTAPTSEDARRRCLEDAELIRTEGARVFGSRVSTGFHSSWSLDPLSGEEWPCEPWWQIDIRSDDRLSDVKHVWEAARHRDLVVLARAAALDPDGEWLNFLTAALERWSVDSPPERGVNWYSSLELALRAIAWAQVLALVGDELPTALRVTMDDHLVASARHIVTELPYTVSSMKNNHLLGDGLGLIVLARLFPSHPRHGLWARLGERLFKQQLSRHMRSDGSMVEDSLSYHRFVLEMLIVRSLLGDAPQAVHQAMHGAALHLQRIGVFDGSLPQYGDWDEGRVLSSSGDALDVAGSTALGLALSGAATPKDAAQDYDEVAWYGPSLNPEMEERFLSETANLARADSATPDAPRTSVSGGIAYVRRGPWTVWFKVGAGPSHGHADLTSVWIKYRDEWVITDPGTGTYNGPLDIRNGLRTSAAHPVIRPDGQDQLGPHRAFRWRRQANGHLGTPLELDDCTVLFGWHDAYNTGDHPLRIARTVVISDGCIAVIDSADQKGAEWHLTVPLHPTARWNAMSIHTTQAALQTFGLDTALEARGESEPFLGWHSPTYGLTEPSTWLLSNLGVTDRHIWGIADSKLDANDHGPILGSHRFEVSWSREPAVKIDRVPVHTRDATETEKR